MASTSAEWAQPAVLDIRRSNFESSIPDQIIDGLSKQPKTLPALLFYSTEGLEHWNHHSHQPEFYPRLQELQILKKEVYDMASTIPQNSVVVDLGSAWVWMYRSLDKVILLLEALENQKKNITYYALDLSAEQLASTLQAIPTQRFQYCRFSALHGTFDDGLIWLKETPGIRDLPHCLLLLGLTIGNFSRQNAAMFLRNIAEHGLAGTKEATNGYQNQSSILLTIDSCKVPTQVLRAYISDGVVPFALSALKYGNFLLGKDGKGKEGKIEDAFNPDEWYFLSEWNYVLGRHEASLIPRSKDIMLGAALDGIIVSKDEKIRFGCSYKYDQEERETLFKTAGLENVAVWSDDGCDVAFYRLKLPVGGGPM